MDGHYASLMRKKVEAIEKMLQITAGQSVLIENDDVEGLAFSMELRQNCIENIKRYEAQMRLVGDTGQDAEISKLSRTALELIREIERRDAANRPVLAEKLDDYREAMRNATVSNKAVKAYMMIDEENSVYFDEKK